MEELLEAAANAETALSDLRAELHRQRFTEGAQQVSAWILPTYDMVCDILDNLENERAPFDKVSP